jgi:hypothetical protein
VSVYVDALFPVRPFAKVKAAAWRWDEACHLWGDTLEELHAFAKRLGLRRSWFQDHTRVPHYDITRNKRRQAVLLGALESDLRAYFRKLHAREGRGS